MANQVKFEDSKKGTDTSVNQPGAMQYLYGSVYSIRVTKVYKLTTIRCFCDLATQPYVGLDGYKSKWIYSSTSPLHTGRDPVAITCSVQELQELQVAGFRGFLQRK